MPGLVFVEERPMEGREVEATPGAVIGREGTDIVVADPEVSRRHAAIRESGGGVAIEDLGSTNGTFVNDRRISGLQPLSDGDTVRIGNTVWKLTAPAVDAGATRIGQVAAPQVTAARSIPADVQPPSPPSPPPAPVAAPAPPPAPPAQPAAPSPAAVGPRGDVPAPPEVAPSAIRRVLPAPAPGQAPAFAPPGSRQITSKTGSAATRVEATVVCLLLVLAVAIGIAIYFASQS